MSRLTSLDKALVLVLVPIWIACFTLGVRSQIRGGAVAGIALSVEGADYYPVLTGDYAIRVHPSDPLAAAGLRAGDRLVRLGDADLRGVGTFALMALAVEESRQGHDLPLIFERDDERRTTTLALGPISVFRPLLGASFALAVSALFMLLRATPTPTVRAYFHFAMCWAFTTCSFVGSELEVYANIALFTAFDLVFFPLAFRFAYLFPDDRAPEGRWHRVWPWFLSAALSVSFALNFSRHMVLMAKVFSASFGLGGVGLLAVSSFKYRRADRVARRQMKWGLFGIYCTALSMTAAAVLPNVDPRLAWLWFSSFWAVALLPLSLVISVLRFNFFDIDRLLSATASYNVIAVLLGAGALIGVPRAAEGASGVFGIDPATSQVALSLLLAALVVPAHRRLRPQIDRVFFKERYAVDHGIAELLPTLSACADARNLTERAGAGLHALFRPEACVVYAAVDASYAPVFSEGRAVPPAFEGDSPLIGTLRGRTAPLSLSDSGRRPDDAPLGPFDRAALETLQAEVVVPIRQGDGLAAFVCLGPKRSGDVYTSTDLSLLAAVADKVSTELRRFDQEEVTREAHAMQESLRRYVPGAVAEQLSSGAELSCGERDVSVLFVDLRGYTGFAERRRAEEIFSTVNRYTETVSQIVRAHAGSVVEFNGDGMMAVFGAPRELAHKERAAVEAGREIVAAVGGLPVEDSSEGGSKLAVGVGIATGEAYVGNIQAVDRMIWSAIGNTTNLAARLQSLTRDLNTTIVIDHATWERAQPAAADFEKRPDVPIRGRRETQDAYLLPQPARS